MNLKTYQTKEPIPDGDYKVLACQTFDDPPPIGEWENAKSEIVQNLTPLGFYKGALLFGKK